MLKYEMVFMYLNTFLNFYYFPYIFLWLFSQDANLLNHSSELQKIDTT